MGMVAVPRHMACDSSHQPLQAIRKPKKRRRRARGRKRLDITRPEPDDLIQDTHKRLPGHACGLCLEGPPHIGADRTCERRRHVVAVDRHLPAGRPIGPRSNSRAHLVVWP